MPHSEIHGSKLIRSSPRLFAAYHVLLRLCMPRHPPNALNSLLRSHCLCSSFVWFGRTFPPRLRSKGCQTRPSGQNSICRERQSLSNDRKGKTVTVTFYNHNTNNDIDVSIQSSYEGTPVHFEAVSLRPASRDIIR